MTHRLALVSLIVSMSFFTTTSRAQTLDPTEYFKILSEAKASIRAGDTDRGIELYSKLLGQVTDDPELWEAISEAWQVQENPAEALNALINAQKNLGGMDEYLARDIGKMYLKLGNLDSAEVWVQRTLDAGYARRQQFRHDDLYIELRERPSFRRLAGIPPKGLSRDESWRFDLSYFVEEVERLHADPNNPADSPAFEKATLALFEQIPQLSDEEVLLKLMRLAALLDDGHTTLYGPGDGSPLDLDPAEIPLKFYWFEDGLFIVDADSAHKDLVGKRVGMFGTLDAETTLDKLSELRGVDNPMTFRWLSAQFYMRRLFMLRGVGVADEKGIDLHLDDGNRAEVHRLEASPWQARRKLRSQAQADTTLWLRNVDKNYTLHSLDDAVYFQFNQVRNNRSGESIADFANRLGEKLRSSEARNLIVDLRHNNGGNNTLVRPLIRRLVAWEVDEEHRLWVLTGKNTFSAAQNFLTQVERYTDAIIVGEPSSSSPNFVGEETDVELPWSRVSASISTRFWQDSAPTDHRMWIYPDMPVPLYSADYFGNRDPALKSILRIINESN